MFWMVIRPSSLSFSRAIRCMRVRSSRRKYLPSKPGLRISRPRNMLSAIDKCRRQREVLVHRLDAGVARLHRRPEMNRLAVEQYLAAVGDDRAAESALISVDLPAPLSPMTARISFRQQVEIGMVERHDATVALVEARASRTGLACVRSC